MGARDRSDPIDTSSSSSSSSMSSSSPVATVAPVLATATTPAAGRTNGTGGGLKKLFFRKGKSSSDHHHTSAAGKRVDNTPGAEQPSSSVPSSSAVIVKQPQRNKKNGFINNTPKRNLLGFLPKNNHGSKQQQQLSYDDAVPASKTGCSTATILQHNVGPQHASTAATAKQATTNKSSTTKQDLFQWQDEMEAQRTRAQIQQKQLTKERDGFCRRVDAYENNGQVLVVEGKPAYELGNYLGGGVAGVVYEGHRLLPIDEYPVRSGAYYDFGGGHPDLLLTSSQYHHPAVVNTVQHHPDADAMTVESFLCMTRTAPPVVETSFEMKMGDREHSLLTCDSQSFVGGGAGGDSLASVRQHNSQNHFVEIGEDIALEATTSNHNLVLIDKVDAPSRSKHFRNAVSNSVVVTQNNNTNFIDSNGNHNNYYPSDASFTGGGLMEETVAIKILNPVGFRTLAASATATAVVARAGMALEPEVVALLRPMEERHVWWLVNPSSRNLRTLQRYNTTTTTTTGSTNGSTTISVGGNTTSTNNNNNNTKNINKSRTTTVEVDRGSAEKGLRVSLVASYQDPTTGALKELPLTRCIEIWGHVPFGATDDEFKQVMNAVDRVNQGQAPPAEPKLFHKEQAPGRVGTETTGGTLSTSQSSSGGGAFARFNGPTNLASKRT
jgi:hypothetical protein